MKRLFILLLICLLPVQVFAGSLAYVEEHFVQIEQNTIIDDVLDTVLPDIHQLDVTGDDQEQEQDDYLMHIGAGDEPVMYACNFAVPDFTAFSPACRSDLALQPPFLPPAGRPPRA